MRGDELARRVKSPSCGVDDKPRGVGDKRRGLDDTPRGLGDRPPGLGDRPRWVDHKPGEVDDQTHGVIEDRRAPHRFARGGREIDTTRKKNRDRIASRAINPLKEAAELARSREDIDRA